MLDGQRDFLIKPVSVYQVARQRWRGKLGPNGTVVSATPNQRFV